jgi:type I restriction enzyme S subunit
LARDYAKEGSIPIIDQGQGFIAGWTNDESVAIRNQLPLIVFGDHTRIFKFVDFPFALGADGTQLLKPGREFNPRFFYYACLNLPLPNRGYNRHFTLLKEQEIPSPPKPEQEKIAAALLKMQRAVEAEDKLIATIRELKRSSMCQLFAHGLRNEARRESEIGAIPKSWDLRPLEEVREFLQYGTSAKCEYAMDGNPVIRIPNVVDGKVRGVDLKWCQLSKKEVDSLMLQSGDVLFIRTNGVRERVGTCAVYTGTPSRSLFASYLIRARLKTGKLNPHFLQYYTATNIGKSFLGGRATPAADGKFNVNTKLIDSILVPLPSSDEQREIVDILQMVDRKLSVHERRRAALQELFRTFLHKFMSGQIRVDGLEIDLSEIKS